MKILEEPLDDLNSRYARAMLPITITYGLFSVVGIFGNVIVLVVFSFGFVYRKSNFRVFVISLGIVDLLTSACLIPTEMSKHRNYFSPASDFACKAKIFFNVWAVFAGKFCFAVVCIDRYRKVCQPFKRRISLSLAAKLCVLLCLFVALVLGSPFLVIYRIRETNMTNVYQTNTTVYLCKSEEKYEQFYVHYVLFLIILFTGLALTEIAAYLRIWCQLWRHWKTIISQSGSTQANTSVTVDDDGGGTSESSAPVQQTRAVRKQKCPYKTLIWCILTMLYFATHLVYGVLSTKLSIRTSLDPRSFALFEGFLRLYLVNNTVNPIVYTALDQKFRETCKHLVKRVKSRFVG